MAHFAFSLGLRCSLHLITPLVTSFAVEKTRDRDRDFESVTFPPSALESVHPTVGHLFKAMSL